MFKKTSQRKALTWEEKDKQTLSMEKMLIKFKQQLSLLTFFPPPCALKFIDPVSYSDPILLI